MAHDTVYYSRPRTYGKGSRGWYVALPDEPLPPPSLTLTCSRVTGDKKKSGVIRKYGLNMSRQAFREKAEQIGFHKVSEGAETKWVMLTKSSASSIGEGVSGLRESKGICSPALDLGLYTALTVEVDRYP